MTEIERTCPRCGLVFASTKLDGICPSCLLANTLDIEERNDEHAFWEDEEPKTAFGRSFSHFEIIEELGRGGMGTVYRARDHVTGRSVAIKILQAHHLDEPDLIKRFRSEVRAVTSLDHRHILPIHEVGEHDGIPFFSMKLATGGSLAQRLPDFLGHPRKAAQLVAKIARGVQHAHEHGILHRDLKPGNILLDDAGEPYVCDFGLAKWIDDDRRLTVTSAVLGTPHYIAPEQASGKTLTISADIYSLGAILYELMTGRPPFVGQTVIETLRQASESSPAKPSSIVNQTPRDLEVICMKALEREPASRYKTAAALADDLENWIAGRPIRARPVSAAEQLWRWARRNPLPATLGATLAGAITALAIGATIAAVNINQARKRAVDAEADRREQLYAALIAQARASRMTNEAGHRTEAIEAIKKAAAIRPSLELRNEAIAALTLVDLQVAKSFPVRANSGQRLAFDKALQTVAVASESGEVSLFSLRDGSLLRPNLFSVGQRVLALIHSGSRYIAARCADGGVYIFETETGRRVAYFPDHKIPHSIGFSSDCVFSADETLLALGEADGVKIFEVPSGQTIATLKMDQPEQCAFSPDGKMLALGCGSPSSGKKFARVWAFKETGALVNLEMPAGTSSFAWSPSQQTLAVGSLDYSIHLFRTSDWQNIGTLQGHRQQVSFVAFNHSGEMLVSNASDRTLRLWDIRTMSELVEATGYLSESSLGFSPDDRFIHTTDYKTCVTLIEVVGADRVCTAFAPPSAQDQIIAAGTSSYSPDSRLLATASIMSIQVFDGKKKTRLTTLSNLDPTQSSLRFLRDGKTLAVLRRRTGLSLYDCFLNEPRLTLQLRRLFPQWQTYAFGSDANAGSPLATLTSERDSKVVVWNSETNQKECELTTTSDIKDASLSPDTKWWIAVYNNKTAEIHTYPAAQKVTSLQAGRAGGVKFSPSGKWISLTGSGSDHVLWNTGTWTKGPALPAEVEEKTSYVAFSADETLLAASLRDQIGLVSLPDGALLATLEQRLQPSQYYRLLFSPDQTQLAAHGPDNSLVIWDLVQMRKQLRSLGLDW
ncbi:MAG: serine/threonine-protein kinase [Nibricoccus sp.]